MTKLTEARLALLRKLRDAGGSIPSARLSVPTKRLITHWMNADEQVPLIDRVWHDDEFYILNITEAGRTTLAEQEAQDAIR